MLLLVAAKAGSSLRNRGHFIIRRQRWHRAPPHSSIINCLSTKSISQRRRIDDDSLSSSSLPSSRVQQTNNNVIDWREYFRSSDYDDAWSAYFPSITNHKEGDIQNTNIENSNLSNNNSSSEGYQKNIIPSIINGTWIKRRHGMNLEPLRMTFRGVLVGDDYIAAKRRDNTVSQEWDGGVQSTTTNDLQTDNTNNNEEEELQMIIKAQEKVRRMESQTRFLCRMLDDLYRTGIWKEVDHPKTERCHRVIGKLLTMNPKSSQHDHGGNNTNEQSNDSTEHLAQLLAEIGEATTPTPSHKYQVPNISDENEQTTTSNKNKTSIIQFTGLAQRAGDILQRMEKCNSFSLRYDNTIKKSKSSQSGTNTTSTYSVVTGSSSYQGIYSDYPKHLSYTKFALPSPTRAIYNMVLLTYSKEVGPLHVAQQAEDVIWSMIVRAMQHHQHQHQHQQLEQENQSQQHDDDDDESSDGEKKKVTSTDTVKEQQSMNVAMPLFPSIDNWNCVLKCWSNSTNTYRAYHAFSFLLAWMEWNKQYQQYPQQIKEGKLGGKNNGMMMSDNDVINNPTIESFDLVLQSCLVDDNDRLAGTDVEGAYSESKEQDATVTLQRMKKIGSGVAIRLWNEMQKSSSNDGQIIDSTVYHQIIQAICLSPELPSSSTSRALAALARVYVQCGKDGMGTSEIVNMIKDATTKSQFVQLQTRVSKNK